VRCRLGLHSWYPYVRQMPLRQLAGFPPIMQRCDRPDCQAYRFVWGMILEEGAPDQADFEFYWRWPL
jgi:hypothetical protein